MQPNLLKRSFLLYLISLSAISLYLFHADTCTGEDASYRPGDSTRSIIHGHRERSFILHLPPSFDGKKKMPAVIMYHGGGGNADHALATTGWNEKADAEGFIVAYPNGSGWSGNSLLTWNAGRCCSYAMNNKIDDKGFNESLIDFLIAELNADPEMIYAAGFSNGGMMTHALGCALSNRLAAIAPVGGSLETPDCEPSEPIGIILVHGTDDNNVPFEGGRGKKALVKLEKTPVMEGFKFWSEKNGCSEQLTEETDGNVVRMEYKECSGGVETVLYKLIGGTHSWPGGKRLYKVEDPPVDYLSATDVIWDFFKRHKREENL